MIAALPPSELGTEVMRLVDDQKVTQSSIAAVLGMHRSQLNTKIQGYRKSGRWPMRAARENGLLPAQASRRSDADSPHA
ncbi:hypothetical protein OG333_37005 [Streptomyces anulatus]|uniref:hypothetical protein n=1 Tax=Streptomyces anulatus TaxID=1892 RepID=UPI0033EBD34A|nr:hypothetical protein OG333_37005 [Streptomyces anulatus]